METNRNTASNRVYFFDNLRYFMVLMVVVLHSAGAYNRAANRPVKDQYSIVYDAITLLLDAFLMPSLFFIAGYFALPSLYKKNTWLFIKSKIRRLGIPCLIGIILFGPLRNYIWEYSRGYSPISLWEKFIDTVNNAFLLKLPHYYLWFISLLLLFFVVFALLHKAIDKLSSKSIATNETPIPSKTRILLICFLFGIVISISSFLLHFFYTEWHWVIFGNIIQFQVVRIAIYILSFSLGIYAFHKRWFENGQVPGHFMFWAIFSVFLYILLFNSAAYLPKNPILYIAFIQFLRTFLFIAILLGFISFASEYWDSASNTNRLFSENSYNIYLIHLIFVFLIQLFLVKFIEGFVHIKFIIVFTVSIFLSLLISQYAIKKNPRVFTAGLIGTFVLLLIFLSPK